MDGLTFTAELTDAIAWPIISIIALALLVLVFRVPISTMIKNIKSIRHGSTSIDVMDNEYMAALIGIVKRDYAKRHEQPEWVEQANQAEMPKQEEEPEFRKRDAEPNMVVETGGAERAVRAEQVQRVDQVDSIGLGEEIVGLNPVATVIEAWSRLEREARSILQDRKVVSIPSGGPHLLVALRREGLLVDEFYELARELWRTRRRVVGETELDWTPEEANSYVLSVEFAIVMLRAYDAGTS